MAKKKTELKNEVQGNIEKLLAEKREALRIFRFGISGSKVKNVKEGMKLRKDIARILTELNLRAKEARVKG